MLLFLLQELMNEQSMDQQRPLGETDTAVKPSQVNHVISYHRIVHIKLKLNYLKKYILFQVLLTNMYN